MERLNGIGCWPKTSLGSLIGMRKSPVVPSDREDRPAPPAIRGAVVLRVETVASGFETIWDLAWGPDEALYVASPTLSTYDSVYRIDRTGAVTPVCSCFGRPQGLAFDGEGTLHVVEALAGASGVYRVAPDGSTAAVLAAEALVGLAFDPTGGLVVASNHTAYRVDTPGGQQ